MRKILVILFLIFSFILPVSVFGAKDCKVEVNDKFNVGTALDKCLDSSNLVEGKDAEIEGGFKIKINKWTANIATVLGLLAVGSIVYGAILLTLTAGEDEKIKKAKDVIKWGIIGFLGVVSASTVIAFVVNIMYSFD